MLRGRTVSALVVLTAASFGVLATAGPASAYCATPNRQWFSNYISAKGYGMSTSWASAMSAAVGQWDRRGGSDWRIGWLGINSSSSSTITISLTGSAPGAGFAGNPAYTYLVVPNSTEGEITSGNVYLNSAYAWNLTGVMSQSQKKVDVQTILVHELGHEVYLNQPAACGSMTSAEVAAAMNNNWTLKRAINSDDGAGVAFRKP
jgi:hypothetical protein